MTRTLTDKEVLGKGWSDPFRFNKDTGGVTTAEGIDKVRMSVMAILGTPEMTRFFNRTFGSKLPAMLFEPIDPQMASLAEHYIRDALEKWEKRIVVNNVGVDISDYKNNRVILSVEVTIIKTRQRGSFVFPYYLSEAQRQARNPPLTG